MIKEEYDVDTDDEDLKKPVVVSSSGAVKTEGIDTDEEDMKVPDAAVSTTAVKTEDIDTYEEGDKDNKTYLVKLIFVIKLEDFEQYTEWKGSMQSWQKFYKTLNQVCMHYLS